LVAVTRFARAELVLVAALAVVAIAIFSFAEMADDIMEGDTEAFDRFVLQAMRTPGDLSDPIGPKLMEIAMADLTALGGMAVLAAIAIVVSGFLLIQRRSMAVMALWTALLGGLALSQTLKRAFGRERPPAEYQAAEAINASFPSGHAMLSAIAFLTLGALVAKSQPKRRLKTYVMVVAVLLTLIVGVTRVYLGVHWATDVLAGWCVGVAWATTCWATARLIERLHGKAGMSRPQHGLNPPHPSSTPAPATGE